MKIGDMIRVVELYEQNGPKIGSIGTIIEKSVTGHYLAEFPEKFEGGHNGNGIAYEGEKGKYVHCWILDKQELKWELCIPNNELSKVLYPNYIESENGDYLVPKNIEVEE